MAFNSELLPKPAFDRISVNSQGREDLDRIKHAAVVVGIAGVAIPGVIGIKLAWDVFVRTPITGFFSGSKGYLN